MEKNILYWLKKMIGSKKQLIQQSDTEWLADEIMHENLLGHSSCDYIELQNQTIKDIINAIDHLVCSVGFMPESNELHIYIRNNLFFIACKNCNFDNLLRSFMQMEKKYTFCRYILHEGECDGSFSTYINKEVSIEICEQEPKAFVERALVKSLVGNGNIIGDEVKLTIKPGCDTDKNRYNIGVGQNPKLDNGSVRFNHIAIDDDPSAPSFGLNKYVSRAHAYIQYGLNGFTLYVEDGGTPLRGKRTSVFRNGQLLKLDLPGIGVPLKHGDQIILSKSVILLFEQIE